MGIASLSCHQQESTSLETTCPAEMPCRRARLLGGTHHVVRNLQRGSPCCCVVMKACDSGRRTQAIPRQDGLRLFLTGKPVEPLARYTTSPRICPTISRTSSSLLLLREPMGSDRDLLPLHWSLATFGSPQPSPPPNGR